jgi:hypothetical protein
MPLESFYFKFNFLSVEARVCNLFVCSWIQLYIRCSATIFTSHVRCHRTLV